MIYSGRYKVTSPFGKRTLNGVFDDHRGIDVVGIDGKYVCSVTDGYVAVSTIVTDKSNRTWEWGNYVCVIGKDGTQYYYCHLDERLVSVGKEVKEGDHLGVEGNSGYSFGNHCHFEVRDRNGNVLDPSKILGINNIVGIYGRNYREECKLKFNLSESTMQYLDKYKYAMDLYRKLMENG